MITDNLTLSALLMIVLVVGIVGYVLVRDHGNTKRDHDDQ